MAFHLDYSELSPLNWIAYGRFTVFAIQYGAMVWLSLIQGIVLFQRLPKQQFALTQSILFPIYFLLTTLGLLTMTGLQYHIHGDASALQLTMLGSMLLMAVANQLYAGPETTRIMWKNHAVKREHEQEHGEKAAPSAQIKSLNKQFAIMHSISSLLNLLILVGLSLHGVYIVNGFAAAATLKASI